MPTYVVKGVKCTLKDGVVKLATDHCNLCNYKRDLVEDHYHSCNYCGLNIDEFESNVIHFAYAYQENWKYGWFAHAQCYKGNKGTGRKKHLSCPSGEYLYIINYEDKK